MIRKALEIVAAVAAAVWLACAGYYVHIVWAGLPDVVLAINGKVALTAIVSFFALVPAFYLKRFIAEVRG